MAAFFQQADTDSPEGARLNWRVSAEGLAERLPALLVQAQRIAVSITHGTHGRRRAGPGEDFWQYRDYSFGDSVQRVDWRKSARSDRILIRENEWAATNTLWLWTSQAAGMHYCSPLSDTPKQDRAVVLSLALSILAMRAGERVGIIGAPFPPDHTNRTLERITRLFARQASEPTADMPDHGPLPRFSSCVLIGDFLAPLDIIRKRLTDLSGGGVYGHLVQVLDPSEETFPFEGRTEFTDFATPDRLTIGRAETLKDAYRGKLLAHRDGLKELATRLGWSFTVHHTDQSPHAILLSLFMRLSGAADRPGQRHLV